MNEAPIIIVGAGLTGLSAARHLGTSYELYEASDRVGGHVVTTEEDGFRFDRTGHLLHLRHPEIEAWVTGLLPDRLQRIQRRSMVFSHGRYTRYPYQANTFGLDPRVAYECLTGFLQARDQRERGGVEAPRTFEEFCLAHFGAGFSEHFMIPYNQKLWGVHPREITSAWCQRFVPKPKLEDVIAGAVGLNDRELGYNASFLYPRTGIGELPEAIHRSLPIPARLGARIEAIDFRQKTVTVGGELRPYRSLISSMPLNQLVSVLTDPPSAIVEFAQKLRCNSLRYLDVAVDAPCQKDIHWIYVPEERFPFYRIGCYSNFSSLLAPEGHSNYYVELSDRSEPNMKNLGREVAQSLTDMGLVSSPERVLFMKPRVLHHAYVLYDHAYEATVPKIHEFLQAHDILSTGRYGAWNYSSMEDALIFGKQAADRVMERA